MKTIFIIVMLLSASMVVGAQDLLTLNEAITLALDRNLDVEIARNDAAVAENSATLGNANLLPSVSASGGTSLSDRDGDVATATNATVSASYTLFDGFGNIYRFKRLKAGERLGRLNARDRIESTLLLVSQAYYTAASAYENLVIAQDLLSISRERLTRAEKRSAYGQAGTIDVLSARVDLNSDSVTWTQAKFSWDESKRELNLLLNRDVDTAFRVETEVAFHPDINLISLKEEALRRNAGFLASGERVNQARYDLGSAKAMYLPRLDLSGSYGLSRNADDFDVRLDDPSKTATVGATLSFSLFNGLQTHIQRQNSRIALDNQELLQEQVRLELEKDVTSAFEAYRNSLLVLELEERSVEAAMLNFRRTEELYQLGQVTTTQFREAQLNLIQARSALSAAKYDAKLNEVALLRLSGRLVSDEEAGL